MQSAECLSESIILIYGRMAFARSRVASSSGSPWSKRPAVIDRRPADRTRQSWTNR